MRIRRLAGAATTFAMVAIGAMASLPATAQAATTPVAGTYTPLDPVRVLDTRDGTGVVEQHRGPLGARKVIELHVAGTHGVPATGASAVVLNVTVTEAVGEGYVSVFPCGQPLPTVSNVNWVRGKDKANLVTAKLGTDGDVCFYAYAPTQLIADLAGFYGDDLVTGIPGSRYVPTDPARIFDTRDGTGVAGQRRGPLGAGEVTELQITGANGVPDTGVTAAALNVTITDARGDGYLTVFPCGQPVPTVSNVNYVAGKDVANMVTVKVGAGGKVCFFAYAATEIVADLNGYFVPGTTNDAIDYFSVDPARVLDTRDGTGVDGLRRGPLGGGKIVELQVAGANGVPDDARAVVLNVTVTDAVGFGYVTVFPCGRPLPAVSNLNYAAGEDVPNLVTVRIGDGGKVCMFTYRQTEVIADLFGYYAPHVA
ncbi:MAG: hypothetical protein AB7L13_23010 [Acidimicrobiia bacterium]